MFLRSLHRPAPGRVLWSGGAASVAYLAAMAIDMRVTGNRYDDLVLWGDLATSDPRRQRALGLAAHFGLGTALAAAYGVLLPVLPRLPGWLLGLLFVQVESVVAFPTVIWVQAHHPAVISGKLPRLWSWQYFLAETGRHAAYGIVLGMTSRYRERP